MKIHWDPTPKVKAHLGMWGFIPSHSHALPRTQNVTPMLHFSPAPLQALALVTSPKLRLQHHKCQIIFELNTNPREIDMDFKQMIYYEIENDKKYHETIVMNKN